MPNYSFSCGACGYSHSVVLAMKDCEKPIRCPECATKMTRIFSAPQLVKDVDSHDGRVHEPVPMPAFGPDAYITSRSQLKDLQERSRDITMKRTTGDKRHFVRDPETGKMETVTVKGKEIDMGEVHTLDKKPTAPDMPAIAIREFREAVKKQREGKAV